LVEKHCTKQAFTAHWNGFVFEPYSKSLHVLGVDGFNAGTRKPVKLLMILHCPHD